RTGLKNSEEKNAASSAANLSNKDPILLTFFEIRLAFQPFDKTFDPFLDAFASPLANDSTLIEIRGNLSNVIFSIKQSIRPHRSGRCQFEFFGFIIGINEFIAPRVFYISVVPSRQPLLCLGLDKI